MSTGFSFGAKTTAAPTFGTGSITFGTSAAQPAQQFGFGGMPSSAPPLFGTQTAPTSTMGFKPTGFGAPTSTSSTGFGLSIPTASSGFGATGASSGFGAPAAVSSGFGAPAASSGFGAPAASSGFGAPAASSGFGAPAASSGFGAAASTPATGFGFGAATPASSAPAFGAAAPSGFGATASTGFGAPAAPAAATLGFGTPATTTTGLSFGTSASTGTGLSFGTPASTAAGLSFGTPATTSTGLSFGAAAGTTPALSFGAAPPTGLSFGTTAGSTGLSFVATTMTAPTLGLSFGTASTAAPTLGLGTALPATSASTGLNFGTPAAGGLSFGLGGLATSTSANLGLGAVAVTTQQQSVGLGGIASQSKPGTAATTTQKEIPPKEQPLPNEFLQNVEQFKNLVQLEKNRSSDVARCSVKEFRKVENDLDVLQQHFNQVENMLLANKNLADQLKYDTAKGLQNIEMAQRTQETPPGLQYDNTAPLQFFLDLADTFEKEMQLLKVKIDNTEKFVKKCGEWNVLTSQDLAMGMRRLHETFVALSGRMQSIHNQVETQKENFLSVRRLVIKDNINPFEKPDRTTEALNAIMINSRKPLPQLASGPTPFNNMTVGANNIALSAQQTQQPPSYPSVPTTTTGLSFGIQGSPASNFQLQKPPTGNKRGKQYSFC